MKKRFFNTLALIGLVAFSLLLALSLLDILKFNSLPIKYLLLLSLLLLFIGLSQAFNKFTDYTEGVACLRRASKTLNLIKSKDIRKINYVRLLSIKNQLNNAEVYLKNVVDKFDLYELGADLAQINDIKHHYDIGNKHKLSNEMMVKDLQEITKSLEKVSAIKSQNIMIK
ncbi:MAG: hypothetical protein GX242_04735 [Clostridiales bacterium]|nr:hypothetical protein [Clostridiales bacterium]